MTPDEEARAARDERADLRRIVLEAAGLPSLQDSVDTLVREVRGLRGDITRHPQLEEVEDRVGVVSREVQHAERRSARRRRRQSVLLVASIWFAIQAHDQHIDRCGAGSSLRTAARQATVDKVAEQDDVYHFACDASAPFHTHDGDPYPSAGNVVGGVVYAIAAAGGIAWVRRARPIT